MILNEKLSRKKTDTGEFRKMNMIVYLHTLKRFSDFSFVNKYHKIEKSNSVLPIPISAIYYF